jgi:tetratricopeptide (TPR) repeat protein
LPAEPAVMARAEPPVRRPVQQRLKLERAPVESGESRVDEDGVENVVLRPAPRAAGADSRNVRPATDAAAPVAASDIVRAYEALQAGDTAQAKALYADVLKADPKNIDALLGMGAIAWKDGRADEAGQFYQRVLELEPRNAYAQAGLISIMGGADPAASESRLRQLIAREPSAFLYFTLGNLYADQGQWPGAQQAYFQAYQSQPDNPDYAFNLAVGLEHLGQTRQALDYYRKALDLSFRKGRANFDQSLVIQRVGQLSSRVEQ